MIWNYLRTPSERLFKQDFRLFCQPWDHCFKLILLFLREEGVGGGGDPSHLPLEHATHAVSESSYMDGIAKCLGLARWPINHCPDFSHEESGGNRGQRTRVIWALHKLGSYCHVAFGESGFLQKKTKDRVTYKRLRVMTQQFLPISWSCYKLDLMNEYIWLSHLLHFFACAACHFFAMIKRFYMRLLHFFFWWLGFIPFLAERK